jgi:hypothetical protein
MSIHAPPVQHTLENFQMTHSRTYDTTSPGDDAGLEITMPAGFSAG